MQVPSAVAADTKIASFAHLHISLDWLSGGSGGGAVDGGLAAGGLSVGAFFCRRLLRLGRRRHDSRRVGYRCAGPITSTRQSLRRSDRLQIDRRQCKPASGDRAFTKFLPVPARTLAFFLHEVLQQPVPSCSIRIVADRSSNAASCALLAAPVFPHVVPACYHPPTGCAALPAATDRRAA